MAAATQPVGIIGVGLVGLALAERAIQGGFAIIGHDVDPARLTRLAAVGGTPVDTAADVFARVPIVMLALLEPWQTESVVNAALPTLAAGTTIIDCGTGDPLRMAALAADVAAHGGVLLDAPLSGSSAQIRTGESTMLAGGDRTAYEAVAPLLDAITPTRFHLGNAGSGTRAKLATNLLLGLNRAALAEALAFAESLAIDTSQFLDLVRATPAYSRAVDAKGRRMVERDYGEPESRVRQHRKDLRLIDAAAERAGCPLPLTRVHAAALDAAIEAGFGDADNAAIVETWRLARRAGPITP
jgi:3-hydroxyisobutyrate dehydrogenase-like beta-hydroxyacid dehydrogenase